MPYGGHPKHPTKLSTFFKYLSDKIVSFFIGHFLPKRKNWVGLTVVNVRAVKNGVQLHKNVVKIHITEDVI